MDIFTFVILLVYLLAIGYLGYQGYIQTKTASGYLVAGRNANPVVMALSYARPSSAPPPSSASAAWPPTSAWGRSG